MIWGIVFALALLTLWLGLVSYQQARLREELGMLILQLKKIAGDRHIGGTSGRSARKRRMSGRIDFRLDVDLEGFVRVGEHARPCRIVDVSRSGCQITLSRGGLPIASDCVLSIEFSEFGKDSTRARIIRELNGQNAVARDGQAAAR
ncbi:MAG: PilZ domain-containing protein, partial [Myxococcota bacterium]